MNKLIVLYSTVLLIFMVNINTYSKNITYKGKEYIVKDIYQTKKIKNIRLLICSNIENSTLFIENIKSKKIIYQSFLAYDSYRINKKSIKIIDLDRNGVFEILYSMQGDAIEYNDNIFVLISNNNGVYKHYTIENGDVFNISDLNNDGYKEIIHKYGKDPMIIIQDFPAAFKEDIYVFKNKDFVKIKNYCKYKKFLKKRLKFYNNLLNRRNAIKKKLSSPEKNYFHYINLYREETLKRLKNCK